MCQPRHLCRTGACSNTLKQACFKRCPTSTTSKHTFLRKTFRPTSAAPMARLLQNVEAKLHAATTWRPSNILLIHTALHLAMALCCAVLTHADAASHFQSTTIRIAARIDNPSDFLASPRKFLQHDEWSITRQIEAKQTVRTPPQSHLSPKHPLTPAQYLALVARYLPLPIPWTMGLNSTMGTAYAAGFAFAACAVAHGFMQDPMHFPARDALKRAVGAVAFAFANYLPWEAMFDL